jgi:hypothetical protein
MARSFVLVLTSLMARSLLSVLLQPLARSRDMVDFDVLARSFLMVRFRISARSRCLARSLFPASMVQDNDHRQDNEHAHSQRRKPWIISHQRGFHSMLLVRSTTVVGPKIE